MFNRLIFAIAALSLPVQAMAQQPVTWKYRMQDGVATATYPGNVVVNGNQSLAGQTTAIGTNLYPAQNLPVSTVAGSTNGSPVITVASAAGLIVGASAYGSFLPSFCATGSAAFRQPYITGIVGNSVTLSCNASATQSGGAVQFGQTRYDATSNLLANYGAFKTVNIGQSAFGASNAWQGQVAAGMDYPLTFALNVTAPVGGGGGINVAARSSDATGGFTALPLQCLMVADTWTVNQGGWCAYFQSNLYPATAGAVPHHQIESSVNNQWPEITPDPYRANQVNGTTNLRLDCGTGQQIALGQTKCSNFIDMIWNGARTKSGITIFDGALDTDAGRIAPAVLMPQNVGMIWNHSADGLTGRIYGKLDGPFPRIQLDAGTNGSFMFNVGALDRLGVNSDTLYPVFANQYNVGSDGSYFAGVYTRYIKTVPVTVATLSTCGAGTNGLRASVTDATLTTFYSDVTGGGANSVPVFCNGTSWVIG